MKAELTRILGAGPSRAAIALTAALCLLIGTVATPLAAADPVGPASAKRIVTVPASIDASGTVNVAAQLQSIINRAPNGSTIRFRKGARYRLGTSLVISRKRNLTLNGNGATLRIPSTNMGSMRSTGIQVRDGAVGTTIRNLTIIGSNAQAGTRRAFSGRESNHGIAVLSARRTLIKGVTIRRTGADCLYISRSSTGGRSRGVTFRRSTCRLSGRHGVGLIAGNNVRIVQSRFDKIGFDVIDIEPNRRKQGARNVLIRGNRIGSYALDADYEGWLLAACGPRVGAVIRGVTVTRNVVEGGRAGWSGRMKALSLKVCGDRGPRRDFTVTRNVGKRVVVGPAISFTRVKGVTVRGNRQPLSRGPLAIFPGSTRVTSGG